MSIIWDSIKSIQDIDNVLKNLSKIDAKTRKELYYMRRQLVKCAEINKPTTEQKYKQRSDIAGKDYKCEQCGGLQRVKDDFKGALRCSTCGGGLLHFKEENKRQNKKSSTFEDFNVTVLSVVDTHGNTVLSENRKK